MSKSNRADRADRAKDGKTLRRMARRDKARRAAFERGDYAIPVREYVQPCEMPTRIDNLTNRT